MSLSISHAPTWKLIAVLAMGVLAILIASGFCRAPQVKPPVRARVALPALTQADADAALRWIQKKMPNTPFVSAEVAPEDAGLVRLHTANNREPLYFDPHRHALLIGLVINFDDPKAEIAGGHLQ